MRNYIESHYRGMASLRMEDLFYVLARCHNCSLAFQLYVPSASLLSEIYDVWIPKSVRAQPDEAPELDDYRYLAEQVEYIIQQFSLPPHEISMLDFGFGWAEWARMAMAYGCNVSGIELSRERIDYALSIGLNVVETNELDGREFHFINIEQVLEHLVEPRDILARLIQSLRIGGIIKISVPDASASLRKICKTHEFSALSPSEIMAIAPLEHVNSFTRKSLISMGKSLGLVPLYPGLRKLYNSSSGWLEAKNAIRLIGRPIYRHVFPRSTFIYFIRPQAAR